MVLNFICPTSPLFYYYPLKDNNKNRNLQSTNLNAINY